MLNGLLLKPGGIQFHLCMPLLCTKKWWRIRMLQTAFGVIGSEYGSQIGVRYTWADDYARQIVDVDLEWIGNYEHIERTKGE